MTSHPSLDDVRAALPEAARAWVDAAIEQVRADTSRLGVLFPAVGRSIGRDVLDPPHPDLARWTLDDAGRTLLLAAHGGTPEQVAREARTLYRYGDAAERRGVLRALDVLDPGAHAVDVVEDALRTNDTRLVAAALGPYGARHLDAAAWRHGVLKCVFVGVSLDAVAGLDERADGELRRMLVDYAHERVAAGRDVPDDVWRVADRSVLERLSSDRLLNTPREA